MLWGVFSEKKLLLAAWENYVKTAKLLISKGANVNAGDNKSWTPLHWAVYKNSRKTAELLISKGADVNAKAEYGITPLHLAKINDHTDMVNILRRHGAK